MGVVTYKFLGIRTLKTKAAAWAAVGIVSIPLAPFARGGLCAFTSQILASYRRELGVKEGYYLSSSERSGAKESP
jgi:hypothetical protein